MDDSGHITDYGFGWGPMEVGRMYFDEHHGRVLGVKTEHRSLQVAVSPEGRSIRVWLDGVRMAPIREEHPTNTRLLWYCEYDELLAGDCSDFASCSPYTGADFCGPITETEFREKYPNRVDLLDKLED